MNMKIVKYKEIGKIKSGKRLPKGFYITEKKTNNKYIRVRDINNNYIDANNICYITDEACQYLKRYRVKKNDIIISVVGTIGNVAQIPEELDGAYLTENCNNLLINEELCLKDYLKYYLTSELGKKEIKSHIVGSTQPKLPIYGIQDFNIILPTINLQKKISKLLNIIDSKIKINNQINDNLYKLGLTYYKEWVSSLKYNQEATYKEIIKLGKIVMGQSPKGESYNNNNIGLPLINGAADYENGYLKAQKYTNMPTKICKKNDLIFCIRATIGLLTICDKEYCLGRGVASITNIYDNYKEYAYYLINNSIEEFKKLATGSVIIGISKDDIGNIKVKVPTDEQINYFHNIQKPIFEKIENIRLENRALINMRDTLLPKLMNGEIDLDKVEI